MIGVSLLGNVAQEIFWYMICSQHLQHIVTFNVKELLYNWPPQAYYLVLSAGKEADQTLLS